MKRLEYNKVTVCKTNFSRNVEAGELMTGQNNRLIQFQCPCGCGNQIDLFTKEYWNRPGKNWTIEVKDSKVTLWPSINMVNHDCKSHFWIRDNKVVWV